MYRSLRTAVAVVRRHGDLYFAARDKLPEAACHPLVCETGNACEQQAAQSWLWHGRQVRVVDGTTATMPDTPENQAAYPQPKMQRAGCGFPMARLVVVFSLAVGTVLDAAIGKYQGKQTGENSLFRQLHDLLDEGDVVLADRYFGGWCDIALRLARGVDVVVRKHQLRATDYRRRWQAELYLRSIKIVLQMDHLRCTTPERVRNEIWTHLLGYHLIRGVMAVAGLSADLPPWRISFKGTLHTLNAFLPMLHRGVDLDCWCRALLEAIASHAVGNRPDRFEPRVIRRRPRKYNHMREPRQNYRNRMRRAC